MPSPPPPLALPLTQMPFGWRTMHRWSGVKVSRYQILVRYWFANLWPQKFLFLNIQFLCLTMYRFVEFLQHLAALLGLQKTLHRPTVNSSGPPSLWSNRFHRSVLRITSSFTQLLEYQVEEPNHHG